ncbi:pyridoxamine 5'-phosphate oxidase family protein [Nonomuraea sp. NPDC049784]|uniref:pyridoxamine 5'-phosphate oxidase family protein n=1 Tax=Nonomuraea sp. NPDC049784 TaxID=3154361 RepID=UPI003408E6D1
MITEGRSPTLVAVPAEVRQVLERSLVCEYASLTRDGRPVTWPVTPYAGSDGTLDVTTGLSYPDKAERARRDPRVALLYSDPTDSGLDRPPVVLVQGRAAVRDADLQGNTDRYVRESMAKQPAAFAGLPWFLIKRLTWYFARIYVEVTPECVTWWPEGDLSRAPRTWTCPGETTFPRSDLAPSGPRLPSRSIPPADWRPYADRALRLGAPVVSMVADGHPLPVRARSAVRTEHGFDLRLPAGVTAAAGPVCLTFHTYSETEGHEHVVLVGWGSGAGDRLEVEVERALNDWSLSGSNRERARSFMRQGKELRKRVKLEAARRDQAVPKIRR